MGVPLYPSTGSPTLYMGPWDTIGRHLGSLLLYTVLVSHPIQLSSRHTVGRSTESCVPIGQLDGMGHQDWVLSLCCWTSYEAYEQMGILYSS